MVKTNSKPGKFLEFERNPETVKSDLDFTKYMTFQYEIGN